MSETTKAECKCILATAANTPGVLKGYELGGYVKERCPACELRLSAPDRFVVAHGNGFTTWGNREDAERNAAATGGAVIFPRMEAAEAEITRLREREAELVKALEPFARATDVINISYRVTEAHLAAAKAALEPQP